MRFLLVVSGGGQHREPASAVSDRLALDGHAVDLAACLSEAEDHLAVAGYDLILLDIMLPDGDGHQSPASHRRARRDTPVIIMTARSGCASGYRG